MERGYVHFCSRRIRGLLDLARRELPRKGPKEEEASWRPRATSTTRIPSPGRYAWGLQCVYKYDYPNHNSFSSADSSPVSFRIATFNLENLRQPDPEDDQAPSLSERFRVLRPRLRRLEADVLCLQEVFAQESRSGRALQVLNRLLEGTRYSSYTIRSTTSEDGDPYAERNLIVAARPEIRSVRQYNYDRIDAPLYRSTTAKPPPSDAEKVRANRPFLYTEIELAGGQTLHLFNLHLKSRSPTDVPGQKSEEEWWKWLSSAGWAEGYFLSAMKRVSQALEVRILIDELFDREEDPRIVVCGDFNAPPGEVPVEAIAGRVENTGNPELVDQVLVSCEDSIPESARYTYLYHGKKRLIDHMLISRALLENYRGAEIHNEVLHDESLSFAYDTKFPESDHAPFVGTFDFGEVG